MCCTTLKALHRQILRFTDLKATGIPGRVSYKMMGCYIPNRHTFCRAPAISSVRFLNPFSTHPSTSLRFHLGFQRLALSPVVMDAGGSGGGLFSVDPLERHAARGRGVITSMAAGNDVIILGTSKGWVIRYDFGVGDSQGQLASVVLLSEPFPSILICSSSSQILTSLEAEAVISWCTVSSLTPEGATALQRFSMRPGLRHTISTQSGHGLGF